MFQKQLRNLLCGLVVFGGFAIPAGSAHASLIGDTITAGLVLGGVDQGSAEVVVGPDVEFVGPGFGLDPGESIDISGNSIVAVVVGPLDEPNSKYIFSDLDWLPDPGRITGFTLSTDIAGLTEADIAFGDDFLEVGAGPDAFTGAGTATIELQTTHRQAGLPVPEPAALAILGIGLAGLGFMSRRCRTA